MVERPVIISRARALDVDQVRVFDVSIDTDTDLVWRPPDLVGMPLVYRRIEHRLCLELGVTVRRRLISRPLKCRALMIRSPEISSKYLDHSTKSISPVSGQGRDAEVSPSSQIAGHAPDSDGSFALTS